MRTAEIAGPNKSDRTSNSASDLKRASYKLRRQVLAMTFEAGMGHLGGDFSAADILTVLYQSVLRVDPARPRWSERDRFVLSKGHVSGGLYATLAEAGFFPVSELRSYMGSMSRLNGHPDCNKAPGVEANTGPLGHGLPIAVGMALAGKLDRAAWRVFALTGDGELQEGSNWEAAMCASHHQLSNLTVIVDRNRLQQGAGTEATVGLDPLDQKWTAFGWAVSEVDGHDHAALLDAFNALPSDPTKPSCIIANTIKGKGVSFMENQAPWHHRIPSREEYGAALMELDAVWAPTVE